MNIDILLTPLEVSRDRIASRAVIVIDVFRATSCICNAIENGAKELFPVTTIAEAIAMRHTLSNGNLVLLGGERKTKLIEGFDLDNSPASYSREKVEGATIVMSTTNGTRALQAAVNAGAGRVFVASLLNAKSVARVVGALGMDVAILCAARHDRYTMEDAMCAGMIAGMLDDNHSSTLSDVAWATIDFYDRYSDDLRVALRHCAHYNQILDGGLSADVAYCLERNILNVVPELNIATGSIKGLR